MKYEIEDLGKRTKKIKITAGADEVAKLYVAAAEELAKEIEIPGFRKGLAPLHLAKAKIDPSKLRGEIINRAATSFYPQVIKEALLKPIIFPRLEIIQLEEGRDLIFTATFCEKPEVKLGDYRLAVAQAQEKNRTILGVDGQPANSPASDDSLDKVMDAILSVSEVSPADLLIDEEVNHMLSRLIDQTVRLGLTVEQYLLSTGKTLDQLKAEYRRIAERTIKLEFILYEIAGLENMTVSEEEISATIEGAPDEKSRQLLQNEENRSYVRSVVLKNKVIQSLIGRKEKSGGSGVLS